MKNLEELETVLRNVRYEIQQFLNEPKADFTNIEYMIYETIEAARALKFYIRLLRNVRHNQETAVETDI